LKLEKLAGLLNLQKNNLKGILKKVVNNQNDVKEIKNDKRLWSKIKEYYSWQDIGKTTKMFYEKV